MYTKIGKNEIISECAELIKKGEIIAFPTETVYGLGGDAFNENAVKKIYEAKNRPSDNPFIVHVSCIQDIDKVAYLTDQARRVFEKFSPGPITVVLKKKKELPYVVTAGLDTVGVRIPSKQIAREFLQACGTPIAAPSANISKRVSPTTAERVYEDLNGKIHAIIDGGQCDVGIESTVLSLVDEPVILRPGAITAEMLAPVLGQVTDYKGKITVAPAPGMKYAHYCPQVPCVVFSTVESVVKEYENCVNNGKKAVALALTDVCEKLRGFGIESVSLGNSSTDYMRDIFEQLRKNEKIYDFIFIQGLDGDGIEKSIMNRMLKSSGGKVI